MHTKRFLQFLSQYFQLLIMAFPDMSKKTMLDLLEELGCCDWLDETLKELGRLLGAIVAH